MPEDPEMRRAKEVGNFVSQAAYTRQKNNEQGGAADNYRGSASRE